MNSTLLASIVKYTHMYMYTYTVHRLLHVITTTYPELPVFACPAVLNCLYKVRWV